MEMKKKELARAHKEEIEKREKYLARVKAIVVSMFTSFLDFCEVALYRERRRPQRYDDSMSTAMRLLLLGHSRQILTAKCI